LQFVRLVVYQPLDRLAPSVVNVELLAFRVRAREPQPSRSAARAAYLTN
jgi:hypothetical protein